MINTDVVIKIAQKWADKMKDDAYDKLFNEMKKRDTEAGGKGQISRNLLQSIVSFIEGGANYITIGMKFDEYGVFVDEGVKGNESVYSESSNSPFQFKGKMPPTKVFSGASGWISRKAIIDRGEVRKKTGLKGGALSKAVISKNKSLAFVIARSIQRKGIKAYHFTSPIFDYIDEISDELGNAIGVEFQAFVINEIENLDLNKK